MMSWCHDVIVSWCHGVMVSWCHDIMVSWYHGGMVSIELMDFLNNSEGMDGQTDVGRSRDAIASKNPKPLTLFYF